MENKEVAEMLENISKLLALRKAERSRIIGYQRAARAVEQLPERVEQTISDGRLRIRGVGETLIGQIIELVETGRLPEYDEMVAQTPLGQTRLLEIPGIGPGKAQVLAAEAGIDSLDKLEQAALTGGLKGIKGFGQKTIDRILAGIDRVHSFSCQVLLATAVPLADRLLELLAECPAVIRCEIAGSLRRGCEVVQSVDLVVSSENPEAVQAYLSRMPLTRTVVQSNPAQTKIEMPGGVYANIQVVSDLQFPMTTHHVTGSSAHRARLSELARSRGMSLDECGVFRDGQRLEVADEESLYALFGLPLIPAELREDRGELEAAGSTGLPELVRLDQLRGTFHCHTVYSDGLGTIEEMALTARDLGWEYLGVSDHSQTSSYAGGLPPAKLEEQMAEIDTLNQSFAGDSFRLLKGGEVDILPDGRLDYPDELLQRLDFVIASIHSHFDMPLEQMTSRVLAAVKHPLVNFIAHPTGRLLLKRDPYQIDLDQLIQAAGETGTCLEINASPRRLDIDWIHARKASQLGIPISINPDAHQPSALRDVRYGISIARRAWLPTQAVLNTKPWEEIQAVFQAKRNR